MKLDIDPIHALSALVACVANHDGAKLEAELLKRWGYEQDEGIAGASVRSLSTLAQSTPRPGSTGHSPL